MKFNRSTYFSKIDEPNQAQLALIFCLYNGVILYLGIYSC